MTTSYGRSLKTPAGYSGDFDQGRRTLSSKVYIGKIKDNRDILSMGRLRVWIRDLDPDEKHEAGWQTVSYCSPFAGATPIRNQSGRIPGVEAGASVPLEANTFERTQKTYGWWGVPPDLDNLVLCVFADGQQSQGFWIGCIFQEQMNQMVPAIGTDDNKEPKSEYNRTVVSASANESVTRPPDRPEHTTLKEGLRTQGLLIIDGKIDFDRGLATASAKRKNDHGTFTAETVFAEHRDQPAKVYGFLSPGGTQFVFDDLEGSEYVRLRTKTGAQITLHEGTGFVYLINKDGTAWIELAADGNIDVYSNVSVNVRAERDINLRADRDINIESGRNINIKAVGETAADPVSNESPGNIKIEAANDMDITIDDDIRIFAGDNYDLKVTTDIFEESTNRNIRSTNTMRIQSADYHHNSTSFDANAGPYNLTTENMNLNVSGNRITNVGGNEAKFTAGGFSWINFAVHMRVKDPGGLGAVSGGTATSPTAPGLAIRPFTNIKINIDFSTDTKTFVEEKKTTVVTRFPTHEPFPDHIRKARALEIPKNVKIGDSGLKLPGQTSLESLAPVNVQGPLFSGGDIASYVGTGWTSRGLAIYERVGTVSLVSASQLGVGDAGLNLIAEKEGFISFAMPDVGGGATVIGFGHTLTQKELRTGLINVSGTNFKWKDGISEAVGRDLLSQDISTRFAPVIDQNVIVPLTQNQKDALTSFTYNVGPDAFIKSALLKKLNNNEYSAVTDELMRWTYATNSSGVKTQFNGLITRRRAEADLFSS